ncbi:hypothetical protein [Tenacibaculum jejuense]|uniref:Lipoprotein n=1 Tax=Tenacibaculum jejuense TaxID=584609 RepID=A0A238U825_9FLAO|nr:hypothetical protein [Tenacibaculum jejuense]SNR15185.1 conserved exported protein of unknown function [Tenacibaculum jejuense]
MKTKIILITILSLLTFTSYGQNSKEKEPKSTTTNFELKTSSIEKLHTFNWNALKEIFKENDDDQEITIGFIYENKAQIDDTKVKIDNFEIKLSGKTSDLDKMTKKLKKSFDKLEEFKNKN